MLRTPSKTEAGQAHLFSNSGSGRTLELGRSERTIMRPPAPARRELRGRLGQQPDRQIRRSHHGVGLTRADSSRVRGARRASDVGRQSDPQSGGQQSDLRSGRPARAGWAAVGRRRWRQWVPPINRSGTIPVGGERWCGGRRGAGRALGGTGSWKTRGIERSGV